MNVRQRDKIERRAAANPKADARILEAADEAQRCLPAPYAVNRKDDSSIRVDRALDSPSRIADPFRGRFGE